MLYRQRPYIYVIFGIVGLSMAKQSKMAAICGLVLVGCGLLVFFMRKSHQEETEKLNVKHHQLSKEIQKKKN
jgi:hypothetical protein